MHDKLYFVVLFKRFRCSWSINLFSFSFPCILLNIWCILNTRVIYEFGCFETLIFKHDVMVCIWLAIRNLQVLHVESILFCLKALGGIKCCVRFSVPRNPVKTLSPVWSSGKGSSLLVWSSGRGLVQVLYPIACVKQWGGDRCFTLFRLVASIVLDVRCINVFTHNSLRDKGDNLAALSGTHRTICSRKLDGWEAPENQSLIIITIFEELRWMWCYAWFGMIDWILIKCYLNAMLSIIGHVLFRNFFYEYHCLWLAYPYLFVYVFIAYAMII